MVRRGAGTLWVFPLLVAHQSFPAERTYSQSRGGGCHFGRPPPDLATFAACFGSRRSCAAAFQQARSRFSGPQISLIWIFIHYFTQRRRLACALLCNCMYPYYRIDTLFLFFGNSVFATRPANRVASVRGGEGQPPRPGGCAHLQTERLMTEKWLTEKCKAVRSHLKIY